MSAQAQHLAAVAPTATDHRMAAARDLDNARRALMLAVRHADEAGEAAAAHYIRNAVVELDSGADSLARAVRDAMRLL